jgi:hypothetical protein
VKVRAAYEAGAPILYDPETDLYDPNDEAATRAFWDTAKKSRPGRPPAAVKRPTLNMRTAFRRVEKTWLSRSLRSLT